MVKLFIDEAVEGFYFFMIYFLLNFNHLEQFYPKFSFFLDINDKKK